MNNQSCYKRDAVHIKHGKHRRRRKNRKHTVLAVAASCTIICMLLILMSFLYDSKPIHRSETDSVNMLQLISHNQAEQERKQDSYEDDWRLILVNRWNPLPENYEVELTKLKNGHAVDSRIYPELQKMFDDARAAGIMPAITSSYRTNDDQQRIMDEKIVDYQAEGYSYSKAKELAEEWVAIPGTSEHQIGLAVDISTENSGIQDPSVVWEWLKQNSYKYGFILRYPEDKTDITGVIYEPWHFRYVGKEAAEEIRQKDVCLEEYLN